MLEELAHSPKATVAAIPMSKTSRKGYVERVCAGGMPLALRRSGMARARWFDDFIRASVERDAAELARIRERQSLADLLRYIAAQAGVVAG